jgi:Uma2 family endonuclease
MSEVRVARMTPDEFFAWQKRQERNYELVDGVPVMPLKAMTGATLRHDRITTNATIALGNQLRGGPCRPESTDVAVRIPRGAVRRPDLTIDCGPMVDNAMEAQEPRLVLEVLSPSTINLDRFRKLDEYKTHPSILLILLVDARVSEVTLWRRRAGEWAVESYQGLDAVIDLPEVGAKLPFNELYNGLSFEK